MDKVTQVPQVLGVVNGSESCRVEFVRLGKNSYAIVVDGVEAAWFEFFSAANDAFGQVFDALWS